jgi:hypothetical protein
VFDEGGDTANANVCEVTVTSDAEPSAEQVRAAVEDAGYELTA